MSGSGTYRTHWGQNCQRNQWVHSQCAQWPPGWAHCDRFLNVPTDHIEIKVVGTLRKYPQRVAQVTCWAHCEPHYERNPWVLSQSTCWVHWGHIVKEILRFFQKVPTGYLGGYFFNVISMYLPDTCWTHCLKNLNVISMYLLVKYPFAPSVGIFRVNRWVLFKSTRILPTGHIASELVGTFRKHPE